MRKIIHIDMDAFYASVEQRDNPELAGRPVVVGGGPERGVVAAASYEARPFGIHSAMPTATALRRCSELILVRPRFDVYRAESRAIREIFSRYTDLVEPLSLDEAYLDITDPKEGPASGTIIARRIREEIFETTGLTASAGVSFNKFLAKTASDEDKPDGLTVVTPERVDAFIAGLAIERFRGVGPVTAEKMHALGIETGADLRAKTKKELRAHFGKSGLHFHNIARGRDDRPVVTDRRRKSIGSERTFDTDAETEDELTERLQPIAERVARRLAAADTAGHTVTLKIKYSDFELITRSRTLDLAVREAQELYHVGQMLLMAPSLPVKPVRLLGITVGNLRKPGAPRQLTLDLF